MPFWSGFVPSLCPSRFEDLGQKAAGRVAWKTTSSVLERKGGSGGLGGSSDSRKLVELPSRLYFCMDSSYFLKTIFVALSEMLPVIEPRWWCMLCNDGITNPRWERSCLKSLSYGLSRVVLGESQPVIQPMLWVPAPIWWTGDDFCKVSQALVIPWLDGFNWISWWAQWLWMQPPHRRGWCPWLLPFHLQNGWNLRRCLVAPVMVPGGISLELQRRRFFCSVPEVKVSEGGGGAPQQRPFPSCLNLKDGGMNFEGVLVHKGCIDDPQVMHSMPGEGFRSVLKTSTIHMDFAARSALLRQLSDPLAVCTGAIIGC